MWLILALILFGLAYDWLTTCWIIQWFRHSEPEPTAVPSVTFFRPIKPGVPDLEEKTRDFLSAIYPGDQVIFGVDETDPASGSIVQSLLEDCFNPSRSLIICRDCCAFNPKINKLLQLASHARHEHWIILDSELEHSAKFLSGFRQEWSAKQCPIFSAPYLFRSPTLDTTPVLLTLLPGLAVLRLFSRINFTLGACLAITRSQIRQLGGWENFSDFLAEDFEIGHRAVRLGLPVALSSSVVSLDNDPSSLRSTLLHLHRVSVTYRVCQPAGFAASILTHNFFWCLLLFVFQPTLALALLPVIILSKFFALKIRAGVFHWTLPRTSAAIFATLSPLADTICWFAAWLPFPVFWAGRFWKIRDRRLSPK